MEKVLLLDVNHDGVISIQEFDADLTEEVELKNA